MIMREIKFRVYDGEEMIILKNSGLQYFDFEGSYSLGFTVDGYTEFWAHEQYDTATEKSNKFPLMQFTGLKDKNEVEIYEGDIIRILYTDWGSKSDSDPRTLEQYLIDISKTGIVEFNDNAWEVKMYSKKYDDYYHGSISCGIHGRIEIIGNIHENPELLCISQST